MGRVEINLVTGETSTDFVEVDRGYGTIDLERKGEQREGWAHLALNATDI